MQWRTIPVSRTFYSQRTGEFTLPSPTRSSILTTSPQISGRWTRTMSGDGRRENCSAPEKIAQSYLSKAPSCVSDELQRSLLDPTILANHRVTDYQQTTFAPSPRTVLKVLEDMARARHLASAKEFDSYTGGILRISFQVEPVGYVRFEYHVCHIFFFLHWHLDRVCASHVSALLRGSLPRIQRS